LLTTEGWHALVACVTSIIAAFAFPQLRTFIRAAVALLAQGAAALQDVQARMRARREQWGT